MARDLSNLRLRKWERPGRARVKVTHMSSGLVVVAEGVDRSEAKLKAYAEIAAKLGLVAAAAAYTDGAFQAQQNYFRKLQEGEFDGDN